MRAEHIPVYLICGNEQKCDFVVFFVGDRAWKIDILIDVLLCGDMGD